MRVKQYTFVGIVLLATLCVMAPIAAVVGQQAAPQSIPKEKLEQLVAPIALYPDSLLAQVLMASTYPLEVVQAQRWVQSNPKVTGKALEDAMQKQSWDASVKSLTPFPTVLDMMSEKLDWTQQLGDAFLAQHQDIMAAIQSLRQRAESSGSLKTTKEQKVVKNESGAQTYIVIEPTDPSVVYVPAYDPAIAYGTWPYPSYPPYSYYPRGYVAGSALWFASSVAVGAALWGKCNWRRNQVDIDVNRFNQFNRTNISNSNWQHNVEHRKGVPYGDRRVSDQYRKAAPNVASREEYRGRAEDARKELAKPSTQQAARDAASRQSDRPKGEGRPAPDKSSAPGQKAAKQQPSHQPSKGQPANRQSAAKAQQPAKKQQASRQVDRPQQVASRQPSGFQGVGSGGQVRQQSARGQASRHASPGGGARAGGGGRRR
jgi:uncharacterized protein DUF3300